MSPYQGTLRQLADQVLDDTTPEKLMTHYPGDGSMPKTLDEWIGRAKEADWKALEWQQVYSFLGRQLRAAVEQLMTLNRVPAENLGQLMLLVEKGENVMDGFEEAESYARRCHEFNRGRVSPQLMGFALYRTRLQVWKNLLALMEPLRNFPEIRGLLDEVHTPSDPSPKFHAN